MSGHLIAVQSAGPAAITHSLNSGWSIAICLPRRSLELLFLVVYVFGDIGPQRDYKSHQNDAQQCSHSRWFLLFHWWQERRSAFGTALTVQCLTGSVSDPTTLRPVRQRKQNSWYWAFFPARNTGKTSLFAISSVATLWTRTPVVCVAPGVDVRCILNVTIWKGFSPSVWTRGSGNPGSWVHCGDETVEAEGRRHLLSFQESPEAQWWGVLKSPLLGFRAQTRGFAWSYLLATSHEPSGSQRKKKKPRQEPKPFKNTTPTCRYTKIDLEVFILKP